MIRLSNGVDMYLAGQLDATMSSVWWYRHFNKAGEARLAI